MLLLSVPFVDQAVVLLILALSNFPLIPSFATHHHFDFVLDLCRNKKCALEMPRDLALEWHIGLWFRDNHGYADNQQVDPHGEKLLKTHLFFHDTSWTEVSRSSARTKCIGDLEDGPRLPSSYRRTRSAVRAAGIS